LRRPFQHTHVAVRVGNTYDPQKLPPSAVGVLVGVEPPPQKVDSSASGVAVAAGGVLVAVATAGVVAAIAGAGVPVAVGLLPPPQKLPLEAGLLVGEALQKEDSPGAGVPVAAAGTGVAVAAGEGVPVAAGAGVLVGAAGPPPQKVDSPGTGALVVGPLTPQ
jgi:hypothetical protein